MSKERVFWKGRCRPKSLHLSIYINPKEALFSQRKRNHDGHGGHGYGARNFSSSPDLGMHAAADEIPRGCKICLHVVLWSTLLLLASGFLWLIVVRGIMYKEPNYPVAISAVSGLDPVTVVRHWIWSSTSQSSSLHGVISCTHVPTLVRPRG
jgi:hypothetical protein